MSKGINMPPSQKSAPRVLVLDSDMEHAKELVEQLEAAGYQASAAPEWDERSSSPQCDVILGEADTVPLEELAAGDAAGAARGEGGVSAALEDIVLRGRPVLDPEAAPVHILERRRLLLLPPTPTLRRGG